MKISYKLIKRNKKKDFKIWYCCLSDNINGANYYYLISDYIKENLITFKRFLNYNEAIKWINKNYLESEK